MRAWRIAIAIALAGCSTGLQKAEAPAAPVQAIAPANLSAFFDCLRTQPGALVAAHRGGPAPGFAENSLEAFERTLTRAPAIIETDVALLADGTLALMHDETVDRTTNGSGPVASMTLEELKALRLQDETGRVLDAHPPSLKEALDWARGRTILELDVTRGTPLERVAEAVREADAQQRVVIIVRSQEDAITAHRLDPTLMISAPVYDEEDLRGLEEAGVDFSRLLAWTGNREPNAELNVILSQRGVEAIFGTNGSGDSSWDERFAREGRHDGYAAFADSGLEIISTDRPEAAYRALDQSDGEGWAPGRCLP